MRTLLRINGKEYDLDQEPGTYILERFDYWCANNSNLFHEGALINADLANLLFMSNRAECPGKDGIVHLKNPPLNLSVDW